MRELPTLYANTLMCSSTNLGELAKSAITVDNQTPYEQDANVWIDWEMGKPTDTPRTATLAEAETPNLRQLAFAPDTRVEGQSISSQIKPVQPFFRFKQSYLFKEPDMPTRRLVRVIIVDPDEAVNVEDATLHDSGEIMTDLTDQELFFEIEINSLLTAHNTKREATLDKKRSDQFGKEMMLEPVRISDLAMSVVTIASFGT